ncbi:MAG TPA: hypothetical protein VHB27_05560 [Rhodopila sp.]|uniref:hypothetical protein n=1 Tax=Rhodopila sp. TaxID=2480087 RepID=UPI002C564B36|nr:hypothetical protein [Rhodopila sp.]HVY14672.1 hypothetical protein [Rhodopila sp.]
MVFVPAVITNLIMIAAAVVSGFQHARLKYRNPVTNVQFAVMAATPVLILAVTLYNRASPYLSVVFLLIALAAMMLTIRQQRMIPPRRMNE